MPPSRVSQSREVARRPAPIVPRRVLVVDDYRDSRYVTCVALGLRGHTCGHVGSSRDALEAIGTFRPDVVVLEWALRDGSGIGLATRLRDVSAEHGIALRVIAASSQDEPNGLSAAEGFEAYLSKPVSMDELDDLLRASG
jgi:two-component system, OmpR family, response regulator